MKKWFLLIASYFIIAYGVSMQVAVSYVGVEPWTAFHESLAAHWLTIGLWTEIWQLLFLFASYLCERQLPKIGTFLNMLLVGPLVDFFLWLDVQPYTDVFLFDSVIYTMSIAVTSFGVAMAIYSNMGPGAKTQFYFMLHNRYGWRLSYAKLLLEIFAFAGALLLGGNILLGTVLFLWLSPIFIERFLAFIQTVDK